MLACRLCDWHLPCTAPHSIAPGNPMAELQRQPRSTVSSTAGCRRGMVVRWVWAKASVWHCATVNWPTDRLGALVVNICSRDCTICPRPSGAGVGGQNISPVSPKQCNQRQDAAGFAVFYLKCVIITDKLNSCPAHLDWEENACYTAKSILLSRFMALSFALYTNKIRSNCRVKCINVLNDVTAKVRTV